MGHSIQHRTAAADDLGLHITQLVAAWQAVQADWSSTKLDTLHRAVHALAGVAGTWGFLSITDAAHALDHDLRTLSSSTPVPPLDQRAPIQVQIERIKQLAIDLDRRVPIDPHPLGSPAEVNLGRRPDHPVLLLAIHDPVLLHDLPPYLATFGYQVCLVDQVADLPATIAATRPDALLVESPLPDGRLVDSTLLASISSPAIQPPLVILSARDDFAVRLHAIRLGSVAFCPLPIDSSALIDTLDHLVAQRAPSPYRILVVEDGMVMASYYAAFLRQAGMLPLVVTDPLQVAQPLREWQPDVVMLDMYMPGCTGLELAAILRQQPAYAGVPIVFLSTETALDMQLAALQLGGDDFLTKPIQPDHLIAVLRARAERARAVRALMVRDSLTGLFNHTTINGYLDIEIARAQRYQSTLSFALLDIDHFKQVNDTYGHPTGDRVLKHLARLLQQRLRGSDMVGRYGGEEFAVIMPGADGAAACRVIEDVLQRFASVPQFANNQAFTVTFSAGVASLSTSTNAQALVDAADKSLYTAKRAGRNRVILADTLPQSVRVTRR